MTSKAAGQHAMSAQTESATGGFMSQSCMPAQYEPQPMTIVTQARAAQMVPTGNHCGLQPAHVHHNGIAAQQSTSAHAHARHHTSSPAP